MCGKESFQSQISSQNFPALKVFISSCRKIRKRRERIHLNQHGKNAVFFGILFKAVEIRPII